MIIVLQKAMLLTEKRLWLSSTLCDFYVNVTCDSYVIIMTVLVTCGSYVESTCDSHECVLLF